MFSAVSRILRLASLVICLIAIVSFVLFVVNQTSSASTHQQESLNGAATTTNPARANSSPRHVGSVHKAIDDATNELTSPFSGVTAGSSNEWVLRGGKLLFALLVYGFGLGFLARAIRVRV